MSFYIYLLSSLIFTNLLFIIFYKIIANKINLFDHPNLKRKIHKTKVFLGGGILFEINVIVLIILLSFNNFLEKNYFYSLKSYISFFIIPLFFIYYWIF